MENKFLMQIDFIFQDEKKIVGGTNLKYSNESFDLLNMFNNGIMVKTNNGNFVFKVKNVDIFSSISSFINVGFVLYDSEEFGYLNIGDKVCLVSV